MSTIYVSGLPRDIEEKVVRDLFCKHGRITDIDINSSDISQSSAFIKYANPLDADVAIKYRNGDILNGRPLTCSLVKNNGKPNYSSPISESTSVPIVKNKCYAVSVSHLPKGCTVTDLKLFMYKSGPTLRIGIDKNGKGLVEFSSKKDRDNAIKSLNACLLKTNQQTSYVLLEETDNVNWDNVTEDKPIRKKTCNVNEEEADSSSDEELRYKRRKTSAKLSEKKERDGGSRSYKKRGDSSENSSTRFVSSAKDEDEEWEDPADDPPKYRTRSSSTNSKLFAGSLKDATSTAERERHVMQELGVVPVRLDLSKSRAKRAKTSLSATAGFPPDDEFEDDDDVVYAAPASRLPPAAVPTAAAAAAHADAPEPPKEEIKGKYRLWGTSQTVVSAAAVSTPTASIPIKDSRLLAPLSGAASPPPPPPPAAAVLDLSHINYNTRLPALPAAPSLSPMQPPPPPPPAPPAVPMAPKSATAAPPLLTLIKAESPPPLSSHHTHLPHHSAVVTACAESAASAAAGSPLTTTVRAPIRSDSTLPLRPLKPQIRRCQVSSLQQFTTVLQEPLPFKISVVSSQYANSHPHVLAQGESEYGNAVDDWLDRRLLCFHGSRHSVSVADSHWLTVIQAVLPEVEVHLNEYDPEARIKASPDYTLMYRGIMVMQGEVFESAQELRTTSNNFVDKYHPAVVKVFPKGKLCIPCVSSSDDLLVLYAVGCKDSVYAQHIIRHYKVSEVGARLRFIEDVMKILRWMSALVEPEEGFHLVPCVRTRVGPGKYVTLTRDGLMREYKGAQFSPLSLVNAIYSQRFSNVEWGTVIPTAIVVTRVGAKLVDVLHKKRLDKNAVLNQVVLAVKQLHWLGYAHCNICVKNVFVDDVLYGGDIFLGDLEFCCLKTDPPPPKAVISDPRALTAEELDNIQLNRFKEELAKL